MLLLLHLLQLFTRIVDEDLLSYSSHANQDLSWIRWTTSHWVLAFW